MGTTALRESLTRLVRQLGATLRENLSLDLRALALTRIALGLLIISDVVTRSADRVAHYSDQGWLPRASAGDPPILRAYFLDGDPRYVGAVMVLTCVVALSLTLGFQSRLCAALSWFLIGSLHQRCWLVNQGGDDLIRNFLFFSAFAPIGARWSIDAWSRRSREPIAPRRAIGPTTVLLYGQLFLVYFVTGTMKANHLHWWRGEAVYHALSADHFVTEVGQWLYPHWYLLKGLTWGTLAMELVGPFLIVLGPPRAWFRGALALLFIGLHVGIAATLHVGIFSAIAVGCWLFTLPSEWMDALERVLRRPVVTATTWWHDPSPLPLRALAMLVFTHMLVATAVEDRAPKGSELRSYVIWPGDALGLKRRWALFITPRKDRGWAVVQGRLDNQREVDFIRQRTPLTWAQPKSFYRVFENQRWRKMLMRFRSKKKVGFTHAYLRWLCENNPDLKQVAYHYMKHELGKRYDHGPTEKVTLARRNCEADRKHKDELTSAR